MNDHVQPELLQGPEAGSHGYSWKDLLQHFKRRAKPEPINYNNADTAEIDRQIRQLHHIPAPDTRGMAKRAFDGARDLTAFLGKWGFIAVASTGLAATAIRWGNLQSFVDIQRLQQQQQQHIKKRPFNHPVIQNIAPAENKTSDTADGNEPPTLII